jgi:probable F420-dependent oxidoreductase
MTALELGPIGVAMNPVDGDAFLDAATELAALGYATIWVNGGPLKSLEQLAELVHATRDVQVASGIISVDRFDRAAVAATWAEVEAKQPGRFIVGLGGAHGPAPLQTLNGYLDALDTATPTVPAGARVLAALGPRMLRLARDRAAGAYPIVVTPDYTAQARSLLGGDAALAVGQFVAVEPDPGRARELARGTLGFLTRSPSYRANLRRQGFAEDEVARLSDRLVDAVVAWGDPGTVAQRVAQHRRAGADQVVLQVLSAAPAGSLPVRQWRQLAEACIA